jgi:hypothetical protein
MDTQAMMEALIQSDLEAAGMWSGIDDRATAAFVLFDTLIMANPVAVYPSEFQARVALATKQADFSGQESRWQLVSGSADGQLRHGDIVRVVATYEGYGKPPTAARVVERGGLNDLFKAKVVNVQQAFGDELPY